MSSTTNKDDSKTLLVRAGDWLAWRSLFESKARAAFIWDVISPPAMPPAAAVTASTPSGSDDTVVAVPPAPVPQTFLTKPQEPSLPSGNTPTAAEKYHLQVYDIRLRAFQAEALAIKELKGWVENTVSPVLRQTNCLPHQDLKVWYDNLKQAVGARSQVARSQATLAYNAFMNTKVKSPNQQFAWVEAFELLMLRSQAMDVGQSNDPVSWFTSLRQAAHPILQPKLDMMKVSFRNEIDNGTLSFREVANALRFEIETTDGLEAYTKGKRHAAFPAGEDEPTYAEGEDEETPRPKKKKRSNRKKKANSPEQGASQPATEGSPAHAARGATAPSRKACPVCESTTHSFTGCWYAFPKLAPPGFTENTTVRAVADENLKDQRLAAEVAIWDKKLPSHKDRE